MNSNNFFKNGSPLKILVFDFVMILSMYLWRAMKT